MLEFQKKTPGNLIFCKALSVYYPTDEDWASKNAKSFIAECKPTLDAIIGFILENYTDPISSFSVDDINSTLTSKCSDRRRKMLAQLKAAAEESNRKNIFLFSVLFYFFLNKQKLLMIPPITKQTNIAQRKKV